MLYCLTVDLELARQAWHDGARRVEDARPNPRRYQQLTGDVDFVVDRLRRRVGQHFTLEELARAYDGADEWVRELLDDADPENVATEPGTVADAAFHAYARGAVDYRP